ncbi:MAG: nuclear transport factor 2 family protein [Myxococcota bacterium]
MTEVERLLAIVEIQQLAQRYAVCVDARDLDRLVELFVPDVRVGREQQGHAALRADFERQLRATGVSFLQVGNHVVDFESEHAAAGVVYCRGEIQEGGRESSRWIIQLIQYHDRYELCSGRWLFVRRKHLLVYGAELGQNPLGLGPAEWPRSQTGWGTVPEGLASWQRFWKTTGG